MKELKLFGEWSPDILDLYGNYAWIVRVRVEKRKKEIALTIASKGNERYSLVLPADMVVISFASHEEQYSIFVRDGIVDLMMFFEVHGEIASGKYWIKLIKRI